MSKDYRFKKEELDDSEFIFSDSEAWVSAMERQSQKVAQANITKVSKDALKRKRASKQLSRDRTSQDDLH